MKLEVRPGRVEGRLRAPPSKSHTHRAFLLAALSGNGLIRNPLRSDDTEATLESLKTLGFLVTHEAAGTRVGGVLRAARRPLDARESGTTLRLLVPVASLLATPTTFTGRASLAVRPMGPLLEALGQLGVHSERHPSGFPLKIRGPLRGGSCRLAGSASSQFLSGLLLTAPLAPQETHIQITDALSSRPYVDLTLQMLRDHGVRVEETPEGFQVPPLQRLRQRTRDVPGDWSGAAFLLAAAAITGGRITVEGLEAQDAQGDRAIVEHLKRFGARVTQTEHAVAVEGGSLTAADIDMGSTPDLFPVLCAVAACARGTSRLGGAPHLRLKESDRIHAMQENLHRFGIEAQEQPDGLQIHGGRPQGATLQSFGDHRIAMAGLVLGLAAQGTTLLPDAEVLSKSYPQFAQDLATVASGVVA